MYRLTPDVPETEVVNEIAEEKEADQNIETVEEKEKVECEGGEETEKSTEETESRENKQSEKKSENVEEEKKKIEPPAVPRSSRYFMHDVRGAAQ